MNRIEGVIVAVLTPFKDDEIDYRCFEKHLEYLQKNNVNGFFIAGTTGLGPALTVKEKIKLIELALNVIRGKPIIVHITDIAWPQLIELIEYCNRVEVDAIAVTTPYFYTGIDEKALLQYFRKVCKYSKKGVFLYNQPRYTGLSISVKLVKELIRDVDNVIGIKDSSANLSQLYEYISELGDRLTILVGTDAHFYPALRLGAKGIVSALANIFPKIFVELYRAYIEGRHDKAQQYQMLINRVRSIVKKFSQLSAYYELGKMLNLCVGAPRTPLRELDETEKQLLRELFSELSKEFPVLKTSKK